MMIPQLWIYARAHDVRDCSNLPEGEYSALKYHRDIYASVISRKNDSYSGCKLPL